MPVSTPALTMFDGLLDLERSRTFHAGGRPLGLETMHAVLAELEPLPRPQLAFHVAGSEAKTSTTERIAAGLRACGATVGTFTSPHLRDPRERVRIDLGLPGEDELARVVPRVLAAMERAGVEPSWFEALALTARVLFAERELDTVVWETGLGGRLDATRALPADVCVITSISLEHTAVLGDSLAAIAGEKAGILRPGAPVVLPAELPGEAMNVVLARAAELGCPVQLVSVGRRDRPTALAIEALETAKRQGLLSTPGDLALGAVREHLVRGRHERHGDVLFDGAHTVAAAERLAESLQQQPPDVTVFGATSGRDVLAMARALRAVSGQLVLTRVPTRGVDPHELAEQLAREKGAPVRVEESPERALAVARSTGGRVLVSGSLHLVGLLLPEDEPS